MKLRKYNSRIVRKEAKMYLDGYSMNQISAKLNIPIQTISWHLIHPLADINYDAWIKIRKKLLGQAKDPARQAFEEWAINSYDEG